MGKLIYKSQKPYTEDINDLIEEDLEKGRGPDKQQRKPRNSGSAKPEKVKQPEPKDVHGKPEANSTPSTGTFWQNIGVHKKD